MKVTLTEKMCEEPSLKTHVKNVFGNQMIMSLCRSNAEIKPLRTLPFLVAFYATSLLALSVRSTVRPWVY